MIFDQGVTEMRADPAYRKVLLARRLPLMFIIVAVISLLHGRDAVQRGESLAPVFIAVVFMTALLIGTMLIATKHWRVVRHADGSLELKGMGLANRKLGRPGTQIRCVLAGDKWEIQEAFSGIHIIRLPKAAFPELDRFFE